MVEFRIFDAQKRWVGILQNVQSVQWLQNYKSPGEVKIICAPTEENQRNLIDGNRVFNTELDGIAKIVEVTYSTGIEKDFMTVRAVDAGHLLDERVIMATETVTNVEQGIYDIYNKNRRDLPLLTATPQGYTDTTNTERTWGSVLERIITLCEASSLGFKVVFDEGSKSETLTVYKGIDRTVERSPDYRGYLGTDNGVLSKVDVASGSVDFKNVAVVAGSGDGSQRIVEIVSIASNITGEARRELYVDRRDLQKTYQIATQTGVDAWGNPIYEYTDGTYTDDEYRQVLRNAGLEALAEHNKNFSISCNVSQKNVLFGEDYGLGDRMPIKVDKYGISTSADILSALHIYEETGQAIKITLGGFDFEED